MTQWRFQGDPQLKLEILRIVPGSASNYLAGAGVAAAGAAGWAAAAGGADAAGVAGAGAAAAAVGGWAPGLIQQA